MVLTEDKLKYLYKKEGLKELVLEKGVILTPSARQFLTEKGIPIVKEKSSLPTKYENKTEVKEIIIEYKYKGLKGESYSEKPETMTQLFGNTLVDKSHNRIKLRGELDILFGKWILLMKEIDSKKITKLHKDMKSIEEFIGNILKSEILETPLENPILLGESLDKIKEISHNPKKYFSLEHLFNINSDYDLLVLKLNELRGYSRKVEISAVEAFDQCSRLDLLTALNRLSSAIYIVMLKGVKGEYGSR